MYDYDRRQPLWELRLALTRDVAGKAYEMVTSVIELADEVVTTLERDEGAPAHDDIAKQSKSLETLARWMLGRREPEAEPVAKFAKLTSDLVEATRYWSRPKFLNKGDYLAKISALVKSLYDARKDVVRAFQRSGAWKSTRVPTAV